MSRLNTPDHTTPISNGIKNPWQLKLEQSTQFQNEYKLRLFNSNSKNELRSWFGPISLHLFNKAKFQLNKTNPLMRRQRNLLIDKTFTQYFLIEANFYHQLCLHEYRVKQDIKSKNLENHKELDDLLLYIRMTNLHPNQDTMLQVNNNNYYHYQDTETHLKTLVNHQLIQEINHKKHTFYDKNPLPHSHLFDPDKNIIFDYSIHFQNDELQIIPPQTSLSINDQIDASGFNIQ